ncbi:MAG TPA: ABC transporter substrate-binding protein [Acidimicrobiales bacterium]|nr:ABC transporter substrate-binding protein [Acidimicrobiales bacterium]
MSQRHVRFGSKRAVAAMALVAVSTGVVVALPSSAGASSGYPPIPKGPITLEVSADLSGAAAAYGQTTKEAFQNVTLQAFNAAHPNGIDGHKVIIKLQNDASDVTGAVQAANQMVADKAAGVVTVSQSPAAQSQQLAVLTKAKMPVVSTLTGSQYADTTKYPYAFSPGGSVQQEGSVAAKWMSTRNVKRVAVLTDGLPQDTDAVNQIEAGMKQYAPKAKVVQSVTIPSGSVDDSAAIAKAKAADPDLLVVYLGVGYGPVWQAMQSASWSPTILSSAGAWYDGFDAMGSLTAKAYAPYVDCADSPSQTFTTEQQDLFAKYSAVTGGTSVNYLTYIASDSVPVEIMAAAIEKYHSTDPSAIKKAIEGIHDQSFIGIQYTFSPTNHFGLTGQYGPAVCAMGPPYAGGVGKVPIKQP